MILLSEMSLNTRRKKKQYRLQNLTSLVTVTEKLDIVDRPKLKYALKFRTLKVSPSSSETWKAETYSDVPIRKS